MKKTRCPHCHSIRVNPKMGVTIEGGKYDNKLKRYEIEETAIEYQCEVCERTFYLKKK